LRSLHDSIFEKLQDIQSESEIEEKLAKFIPEVSGIVKESLLKEAPEMLSEKRALFDQFTLNNQKRWQKGFDSLETHIVICTEAGESINTECRAEAVDNEDIVFDLVVRFHARASHIAQEILCLLKNGFADAAHARWRVLHEVNVTAMFIAKHGHECARRFYFHDIVDSYDGMKEHKKYEHRLREKGCTPEQIADCKSQYDEAVKEFGTKFKDHYGWAAEVFPHINRVGFGSLEKNVELDHMRPYYKWASQNIHAGSKGSRNRLGLEESKEDILLVGQSNSGMVMPAHMTALSLCQITGCLIMLRPTIDNVAILNIINELQETVGQEFVSIGKMKGS
tara:strand:+ start:688 stop:1698 length:1011 start_codon:yes stop_codon:yes gene_type:complete